MISVVGISPLLDPRGYHFVAFNASNVMIVLIAFTVWSCTVHCREFGEVSAYCFIVHYHSRHSSAILSQQGPVIKCLCSLVGYADDGSL